MPDQNSPQSHYRKSVSVALIGLALILCVTGNISYGDEHMIYPVASQSTTDARSETFDMTLLGGGPISLPVILSEFEILFRSSGVISQSTPLRLARFVKSRKLVLLRSSCAWH